MVEKTSSTSLNDGIGFDDFKYAFLKAFFDDNCYQCENLLKAFEPRYQEALSNSKLDEKQKNVIEDFLNNNEEVKFHKKDWARV